jgi:hypothetical protein
MPGWPRKPVAHTLIQAVPGSTLPGSTVAGSTVQPLPLSAARNPGPPEVVQPAEKKPHARWNERALLAIAILLLIVTVLPPMINLGRYRQRVSASLSRSLGREVTMGSLNLRLLPVPALVLTGVVVHESPAFGAEPALRAPSVTAEVRFGPLWRGRLEISRVELSDASLNLVRNEQGRWNVGAILLQASHVPNAPTAQRQAGPAPRFPYIEITDSRVNVKQGIEKLPYSLLNANLSMWLAEPELWQLRLDGQPVRTDIELGLSDTGILRVEGSLHRATALGNMPIALHGDWTNAPLGQAGRLLFGKDQGWRGDLHATADVAGDLDNLAIKSHVLIANLHREEFSPPEPFEVDATCRAAYSRAAQMLSDLHCRWPVGAGQLLLAGSLSSGGAVNPPLAPDQQDQQPGLQSTLALTVQQLPASFLLAAAGLVRSDFAPAFHLEGTLSGMLFYTKHEGDAPLYAGMLEATQLRLAAPGLATPLELAQARLAATTPAPSGVSTLELTTAPLDLDGPTPAEINAQLTAQGYLLHATGSASIARLEDLGRHTHLLPPALTWLAPEGMAQFDVTRSGGWQPGSAAGQTPAAGQASPEVTASRGRDVALNPIPQAATTDGWLHLQNASYRPRFLHEPVQLPSAEATFLPGEIAWKAPAAVYHGIPVQLAATYPVDCAARPSCPTQFRASVGALDAGELTIRSLDAQALGGALHGEGTVTLVNGAPSYELSTTLTRASAAAAGALFHENWGAGSVTVSSEVQLAGTSPEQLAASATGRFDAEWLRGGLGAQTPLAHFALWTADGRIANGALTLTRSQLAATPNGHTLPVSGSIGFDRKLTLAVGEPGVAGTAQNSAEPDQNSPAQNSPAILIGGALAHPVSAAQPPQQADKQPQP